MRQGPVSAPEDGDCRGERGEQEERRRTRDEKEKTVSRYEEEEEKEKRRACGGLRWLNE
jgi:hypothetical protein